MRINFELLATKIAIFWSNRERAGFYDHSHLSVAKIPPGGFFGEVAIVNETVRSAGSQATVFSELYILEKELLTDLLVDFPEFENTIKSHIEELRLLHVRRDTAKVAPSADQIKMLQDYAADQVGTSSKRIKFCTPV